MQNIIWNVFEFAASISGLKKDFCAQKLLCCFLAILVDLIKEITYSHKTWLTQNYRVGSSTAKASDLKVRCLVYKKPNCIA